MSVRHEALGKTTEIPPVSVPNVRLLHHHYFLLLLVIALCVLCVNILPLRLRTFGMSDTAFKVNATYQQSWKPNFLFITVKTTWNNHHSRVSGLLATWISDALSLRDVNGSDVIQQVVIVTDHVFENERAAAVNVSKHELVKTVCLHSNTDTYGHVEFQKNYTHRKPLFCVAPHCGNSHDSPSLTCKMQEEFQAYFKAKRKLATWFCHFDDDTYVNIPNLVKSLDQFDDPLRKPYFIGKKPASIPFGIANYTRGLSGYKSPRNISWLSGQAICMSQRLMMKLKHLTENDRHQYNLWRIANRAPELPDDMMLSLIVHESFRVPLTELATFYNQYDNVSALSSEELLHAVSLPIPLRILPEITAGGRWLSLFPIPSPTNFVNISVSDLHTYMRAQ